MKDFLSGFLKGLKIKRNFDRADNIKEAHRLACQHQFQAALNILENINLSSDETSVANMTGYLLKAICYAELDYKQSARNSINVLLNMDRWSLNPYYHYVLSNVKNEARKIITEYNL